MKIMKIGFLIDFGFNMNEANSIQYAIIKRVEELEFGYGKGVECEFRFCTRRSSLEDCDVVISFGVYKQKTELILDRVRNVYISKL